MCTEYKDLSLRSMLHKCNDPIFNTIFLLCALLHTCNVCIFFFELDDLRYCYVLFNSTKIQYICVQPKQIDEA